MICCCYWYLNLGGFLICGIKKVIFFVIWFFLCSRDNYLFVVSFVKLRHDSCSIPSPAKIPAHQLPHTPPSVSLLVHCSYFQNYPLPVFLLFLCLPCSFQKQSVLRLILLTDQKNYNQCKTFLIKKKKEEMTEECWSYYVHPYSFHVKSLPKVSDFHCSNDWWVDTY